MCCSGTVQFLKPENNKEMDHVIRIHYALEQAAAAPIMIISYCGIGLPGAYWLSFIKNKGVIGLCMGYFLGVLVHTLAYVTIWLTMNWKEQAIQVRCILHKISCSSSTTSNERCQV